MNHLSREFGALQSMIMRFVLMLLFIFVALLVLTLKETVVLGYTIPVLVPGSPSLAVQVFLSSKATLIPVGIPVVALGPVSSFVAPILMAFLVALLISFPYGLYLIGRFLSPALRTAERQTLARFIVPSLILFYCGCALAYFVIIPQTFAILYSFALPMDVAPLFALDDFISSVFFLTISVGIAFLLPVGMVASSRIGLAPPRFWTRHFRGATVAVVIFSAIITPDGSGVTMAFLSVPLLGLYLIGAFFASSGAKSAPTVI